MKGIFPQLILSEKNSTLCILYLADSTKRDIVTYIFRVLLMELWIWKCRHIEMSSSCEWNNRGNFHKMTELNFYFLIGLKDSDYRLSRLQLVNQKREFHLIYTHYWWWNFVTNMVQKVYFFLLVSVYPGIIILSLILTEDCPGCPKLAELLPLNMIKSSVSRFKIWGPVFNIYIVFICVI